MTSLASGLSSGGGLRRPTPLVLAIIVVALIGLGDASYLTYEHYNHFQSLACAGGSHGHSSCFTVQTSTWSELAGIPVAVIGVVGYILILASLRVPGELGRAAGFAFALVGFLFSAYLTYREAHSIHAYCEWCLGSAACLTILMVLTGTRFVRGEPTS